MGVTLVQSIGDNACFCCGGRCTLVERNYALVICSVGQIFQNLLLLSIMFYLHCTYSLDLIHSPHHLIAYTSNKHTQQALCSSVDCPPLHSTYLTAHTNHRLMVKISPIVPVIASICASI